MPFDARAKDRLVIEGVTYRVVERQDSPGVPHNVQGARSTVYELQEGRQSWALKVFNPQHQTPSLVEQATQLAPFGDVPGMVVCRRTVLSPESHPTLTEEHPELEYSVLMPWVEGPTWQQVMAERKALRSEQSLQLARALASTLEALEQRGAAHTDLSAANVLIPALAQRTAEATQPASSAIELVGVECMYGPGLSNVLPLRAVASGYADQLGGGSAWGPDADRFAAAILIAEMLAWCDGRVIAAAFGDSYFDPMEMRYDGIRYQTLAGVLRTRWGEPLVSTLTRAWHSTGTSDCPPLAEWSQLLKDLRVGSSQPGTTVTQPTLPTNTPTSPIATSESIPPHPGSQPQLPVRQAPPLPRPQQGNQPPVYAVQATQPPVQQTSDAVQVHSYTQCPNCRRSVDPTWVSCPYCSAALVSTTGTAPVATLPRVTAKPPESIAAPPAKKGGASSALPIALLVLASLAGLIAIAFLVLPSSGITVNPAPTSTPGIISQRPTATRISSGPTEVPGGGSDATPISGSTPGEVPTDTPRPFDTPTNVVIEPSPTLIPPPTVTEPPAPTITPVPPTEPPTIVPPTRTPVSIAVVKIYPLTHSVDGRAIEYTCIENGTEMTVIVTGGINGTHPNTTALMENLINRFSARGQVPRGSTVCIMPVLNPDGLAANSRYNANGVDLNRNWNTGNWQANSRDPSGIKSNGGGSYPFSEPETRAYSDWLLNLTNVGRRIVAINYYDSSGEVQPAYRVVGNRQQTDPASATLARKFNSDLGFTYKETWDAYPITGEFINWCGESRISCFDVFLRTKNNLTSSAVQDHMDAIKRLFP